jgi:hypothetical protein
MSKPLRFALAFATVGFVVAVALDLLAHYTNSLPLSLTARYRLDDLYTFLWPTSLGLMATEGLHGFGLWLVVVFLSLENAVLYGLIGLMVGKLVSVATRHRS